MKNELIDLLMTGWHSCNSLDHLIKRGRFGHENKMFSLASTNQGQAHVQIKQKNSGNYT
jgi:hypothetical protein